MIKKYFKDILIITIPAIIIMLFTKYFYSFSIIKGTSMLPNFVQNDIVVYQKNSKKISRFDVVILKKRNTIYIKRIIGLPNEKIEYKDNKLYINNNIITEKFLSNDEYTENINSFIIPEGKYFVLGDNRDNSFDSRFFGMVDFNEIIGVIKLKF